VIESTLDSKQTWLIDTKAIKTNNQSTYFDPFQTYTERAQATLCLARTRENSSLVLRHCIVCGQRKQFLGPPSLYRLWIICTTKTHCSTVLSIILSIINRKPISFPIHAFHCNALAFTPLGRSCELADLLENGVSTAWSITTTNFVCFTHYRFNLSTEIACLFC